MDNSFLTNVGVAIGAAGAGAYGMYQKVMSDIRNSTNVGVTDAAWQQVITTLREEVTRLSERLATVEEQNRKCEEANHALREDIIEMKKQLKLF